MKETARQKRRTVAMNREIYHEVKKIATEREVSTTSLVEQACVNEYKIEIPNKQ